MPECMNIKWLKEMILQKVLHILQWNIRFVFM